MLSMATKLRAKKFQSIIFSWWKNHKRDLPWRRTHDPYKILVSEVMLQQTQVLRVVAKYREFIERYPTINSLADASVADVLRAWKGMGYNRRALYLKRCAESIVKEHKGKFPQKEKELTQLPGVGTYTARAILVFAFKKDVAAVDTNIRQIIEHFFYEDIPPKPSVIQKTAEKLVPKGKSWQWHQALMDYGSREMSKVKGKRKKGKQGETPFKDTNRFFRGRIMDLLRGKAWKENELTSEMNIKYDRSEEFIIGIIDGLMKDGLIIRTGNDILCLPE